MKDRFFVLFQYLLPKKAITVFLGWLASRHAGWLTTQAIKLFVKKYQVDLSEAQRQQPNEYQSFNDFFIRQLKPQARPLASTALVSPVDGRISQLGKLDNDRLIQAKNKDYHLQNLLAHDQDYGPLFVSGNFATLYLSPKDYHRIHMSVSGRLKKMIHVPGALFSVNPATVNHVDGLFAKNERVICFFENEELGHFALILVGATVVGSIQTAWHGVVNTQRPNKIRSWHYAEQPQDSYQCVYLEKGQEMGQFLLGSTVILLFEPGKMAFLPDWQRAETIQMGAAMGILQQEDE